MTHINYETLTTLFVDYLELGWLDMKVLTRNIQDSGIDVYEFSNWCAEYSQDLGMTPFRVDFCALLLEYIKSQITYELTDICSSEYLPEALDEVWVYSNYLDSWYRGQSKLQDILEPLNKSEWSQTLTWFYEQL